MKTVYFVRHGESEGNVSPVWLGLDPALTEKGLAQAEFVAKRVARLSVDLVITSPLVRARKTGEIIAAHIGKPIEDAERLVTEWRHPEACMGMLKTEAPRIIDMIDDNFPLREEFPDSETFSELKERTLLFRDKLEAHPQEHILVVTHYVFMMMWIACVLMGRSCTFDEFKGVYQHLTSSNTGLSIFHFHPDRSEGRQWKMLTWNDHAHL